jgi:hypothetical protein
VASACWMYIDGTDAVSSLCLHSTKFGDVPWGGLQIHHTDHLVNF